MTLPALPASALCLLTACVAPQEAPAPGLANPASVQCAKQGGQLEIRQEAGGEVGYCRLPDGRVIEEWALYRASAP